MLDINEKGIKLTSSDPEVAAVDQEGVITKGSKHGRTIITAEASDGTVSDVCYVWNGTFNSTSLIATINGNELSDIIKENTIPLTPENISRIRAQEKIGVGARSVSSMDGIELFSGLKELHCDNNGLTELDVSKNYELQFLNCSNNNLGSLDVSSNAKLTELNCSNPNSNTKLSEIDVSKNLELQILNCSNNDLESLDVSSNTKLTELNCSNTKLTELDISNNKELKYLDCSGNDLRTLDVSSNPNISVLYIDYNYLLDSIDLSSCPELMYLTVFYTAISELDLSACTKLEGIDCSFAHLTELDLTNNERLTTIICGNQTNMDGQEISMILTIPESLHEVWSYWENHGEDNKGVILAE